jgi:hypothetical protein
METDQRAACEVILIGDFDSEITNSETNPLASAVFPIPTLLNLDNFLT